MYRKIRSHTAQESSSLRSRMRNGIALAATLAAAISGVGGFAPAAALAASPAPTSVVMHLASLGIVAGTISSAKTRCVRGRNVRFQVHKGRKWVTESVIRTSSSGQFTIHLRGARTGTYRVTVGKRITRRGTDGAPHEPAQAGRNRHPW